MQASATSEIDWNLIYYLYCIEMGQSEDSFFSSTIGKVLRLIQIHTNKKGRQNNQIRRGDIIATQDLNDIF